MQKNKKFNFKFRFQEFLFLILVAISTVMLSFSSGGFILNFKNIGFTIISTIEKGVYSVTNFVTNVYDDIEELFTYQQDYEILKEKLVDYEYMQRTNSSIRKENARLKEQLDFSQSLVQKNIPANIISRGADNLHSTIIIDKGSKDGIKKNMSVIAIQNGNVGVVGKIVSVGYGTSQIMSIFNYDCSISARIQNTRDIGLVKGNGSQDLPLSMDYIKRRVISELHYGDVVVTSGENGNYLKEIPIGTILNISINEYNSSLDIELSPIINFQRLESVIVVSTNELKSNQELNTQTEEIN